MDLDYIRTGTKVFIDANIFIYHFTGVSNDCGDFLIRCEQEDIYGVTSINVLLEVLHRLMMVEAVRKKIVEPPNIVSKLKKHSGKIKELSEYYINTQKIKDMGIIVNPVSYETLIRSQTFRSKYGLMVNDSIILACMYEHGIKSLASNDDEFSKVEDIIVFKPGDVVP
jgi:predicted nucleic acid-binding protein